MDDQRPVPTADPLQPSPLPFDRQPAARTGPLPAEPSPPFRSASVVLDDGRAVGLTEPSRTAGVPYGPIWGEDPPHRRWTVSMPFFLQRSWVGVGVWLGALTVAGLAAIMFGPTMADFAAGFGRTGSGGMDEISIGPGPADGFGNRVDDHRASRARTTGGMTDDAAPAGRAATETGRAGGPSDGPDLDPDLGVGVDIDLDLRSPASPPASTGSVDGLSADSTVGSSLSTGRDAASVDESSEQGSASTTSTTAVIAFPGSGSPSTAPVATVGNDPGGETPSSSPDGSTSVPTPSTPPPAVIRPPIGEPPTSRPGTSRPTPGTPTMPTRPAAPNPPIIPTDPPVAAKPPTIRKPVPADTRPSIGGGRARNPPSFVVSGSGASNGRAVGRPR